jgi:protein SCO1/2
VRLPSSFATNFANNFAHNLAKRFPLNQRTISRLSVIAAVVVVGTIIAVYGVIQSVSGSPTLAGTSLGGTPAPAFQLTDQNGAHLAFPQQSRGHPVALAFLYTHCPDVCPLTAEKMRLAAQELGPQANQVAWVAVSLDPANDTPDAAKQFTATHGLTGRLRFLLGTQDQLAPVWTAYFARSASNGDGPGSSQTIDHIAGVFVIDKQGREQAFLSPPAFTQDTLAADLRTLLTR